MLIVIKMDCLFCLEDVLANDTFPFSKKIGAKKLRKMADKEKQKEARQVWSKLNAYNTQWFKLDLVARGSHEGGQETTRTTADGGEEEERNGRRKQTRRTGM